MTSTDLEIVANYTVFQPVAKIKTDPEFGNIQPPTSCYLLPVINFVFSKLEFSLITSGTQVYRGKPSPPTTPPPERLLPRCRREIKLMLTRLLRPHQRLSGNHFFSLCSVSSLSVSRISGDSRDFIEKQHWR